MVIIFLIHFALCRSGKCRIFGILSRSGPIVLCHLVSHVIRPANRVIVIIEVAVLELTIAEIEVHVEREVAVGERVVETTIELRVSGSEILVVIVRVDNAVTIHILHGRQTSLVIYTCVFIHTHLIDGFADGVFRAVSTTLKVLIPHKLILWERDVEVGCP